jgi:hypothetical protein
MAVDNQGNVIRFDGVSWSKPVSIGTHALTAVSCPSATFCVAAAADNSVRIFRGRSWGEPRVIDTASAGQLDLFGFIGITSLTCPTPTFCMASNVLGDVRSYNGHRWTARRRIESKSLLRLDSFVGKASIVGVSCPSPTFCAAVTAASRAFTWDGTSWSPQTFLKPVNEKALDRLSGLPRIVGISCASSTFCAAIDPAGAVHLYDGLRWSPARTIDAGSAQRGNRDGLTAVSCPSATFCMAVDDLGRALSYDGASWSGPRTVDPTLGLSTVSCSSTRFCVALNDLGEAAVYDGSSWSRPQAIDG